MGRDVVEGRNAGDRRAVEVPGYAWTALVLAPLWAFRHGLIVDGAVLTVLYGLCAALTAAAARGTGGAVVGPALALWLGAYTAHHAVDRVARVRETAGPTGFATVEAGPVPPAPLALHLRREPKGHRVLLDRVSPGQRSEMRKIEGSKSPA